MDRLIGAKPSSTIIQQPAPMPSTTAPAASEGNSEEARRARMRQLVAQAQRGGRASTLLAEVDKLGG